MNSIELLRQEANATIVVGSSNLVGSTGSKGDQTKWRVKDMLVKADTQGHEGLAEELTSIFLSCTDISNFVEYHSCTVINRDTSESRPGCYSKHMFKDGETFISFDKLFNMAGMTFEEIIKNKDTLVVILETLRVIYNVTNGLDLTRYLQTVLYLDFITCNEDRHCSNLGVVLTGDGTYKEAPIFDNGLALFARSQIWGEMPYDIALRKMHFEPFGNKRIHAFLNIDEEFKIGLDYGKLRSTLLDYSNPRYSQEKVENLVMYLLKRVAISEVTLWRSL